MSTFSIAAYNLYQFAEPGTFWYEQIERNDYEPDQWAAKTAFIREMLAEMDADVVGFQEVFSVEAFRALVTEAGYQHVKILSEPPFTQEDGGPVIWRGPVVALASRHEILSARVLPSRPEIEPEGQLSDQGGFRRDIIEAEIAIPGLAKPVMTYTCHLKSQGAFVDDDAVAALPDWNARFQAHMYQRATRDGNQVIRRASEAMMLYDAAMARVAEDPDRPVVVMGDLNDEPDSFTLRILTQNDRISNIANRSFRHLEASEKANRYRWQLYSAAPLGAGQEPSQPPTHVGWNHASVLDYVLVSNALNGKNPGHVAKVVDFDTFNQHHIDGVDRLISSDHAPVRATFEIRTEG